MFEACAVIKIQENYHVLGLGGCPRIALAARIARNSGTCKSALQKGISEEVAGQKRGGSPATKEQSYQGCASPMLISLNPEVIYTVRPILL